MKRHFEAMSQNPKTYFLLLCLATLSFASFGQELDSLKTSKKAFDNLELEMSLSLLESQNFNSIPGGSVQVALYAPFFEGGLRLGFGIGFSRLTYNYEVEEFDYTLIYPSVPYSSQLDIHPFNFDLTIGTDFLRKSKFDLTLDVGTRIFVPVHSSYHFDHSFYPDYPEDHSFELAANVLPSAYAQLSLKIPIDKKSSLSIGYGFFYIFNNVRPETNSSSNGVYYQPDLLSDYINGRMEDYLMTLITEPGITYLDGAALELPSVIGGQHSLTVGYRYTFGQGKKIE